MSYLPNLNEDLIFAHQYLIQQKAAEAGKKNNITVLDPKRSNAINIGLTVLPQPRTIKQAILTMDSMVINKEGVEVRSSARIML